jgi:uroporphyrinogen-III decarboxylase
LTSAAAAAAANDRYQAAYRELARKHPSFRARSETTELIVDISLQVNFKDII